MDIYLRKLNACIFFLALHDLPEDVHEERVEDRCHCWVGDWAGQRVLAELHGVPVHGVVVLPGPVSQVSPQHPQPSPEPVSHLDTLIFLILGAEDDTRL